MQNIHTKVSKQQVAVFEYSCVLWWLNQKTTSRERRSLSETTRHRVNSTNLYHVSVSETITRRNSNKYITLVILS